jgi:anti-sigma factor RsiW
MTGRVLQFDQATHKVVDVLLPWFVNGTLEGDELAFVQQHLVECARCQREVEWLREFHAACVAAAAVPESSDGVRHLRRQLEAPRKRRGMFARLRVHWRRSRPWSQWVIVAQLAVIAVLGIVVVAGDDANSPYRTLGAGQAAPATGTHVVVFNPAATESDLRRMLRDAGATIVNGPTQANAYVLDVPKQRQDEAVWALKAEPLVVLIESLGPGRAR